MTEVAHVVLFEGAGGVVVLLLLVFCLLESITADPDRVRNLPKPFWILLVLLVPLVGSVCWLVAGRPQSVPARPGGLPYKGNTGVRQPPLAPDDDPAFLRELKRSNDEHEQMLRRWEDDLKRREDELRKGHDPS